MGSMTKRRKQHEYLPYGQMMNGYIIARSLQDKKREGKIICTLINEAMKGTAIVSKLLNYRYLKSAGIQRIFNCL
jgi:hypothetical protein